jgi:hypothetical protein
MVLLKNLATNSHKQADIKGIQIKATTNSPIFATLGSYN